MCREAAGTIQCFIMTWIQGNRERLLPVESLVGVLSVYKDCLYVQNFAVDGGYQFYDGYRLDRDGKYPGKVGP